MIQYTSLLLVILSGILFHFNRKVQPNILYLSLFLAISGIMFFAQSILTFGGSRFLLAVLFHHPIPFYYLLGPLTLFYVRGTLSDRIAFHWRDAWHLVPFVIGFIGILPYILKPWEFKMQIASELLRDLNHLEHLSDLTLYPGVVNRIARPVLWIGYTVYCLVMLVRFKLHYPSRNRIPRADAQPVFRFILLFLIVNLFTAVCYSGLSFMLTLDASIPRIHYIGNPMMTLLMIGLATMAFSLLINPVVLYGIPRLNMNETIQTTESDTGKAATPVEKRDEEGLSFSCETTNRFSSLAASIPRIMEERQLYRDPDFSLEDLSRVLNVPKHHLYYCFNSILRTRFTRLKSEMRVRHVQKLIRSGLSREKTLDAIAMESGFSSSTSFRSVFKQITGMSPSDYQASVHQR